MGLLKYIVKRLLMLILALIFVTLLIFVIIQLFTLEQRAMLFITSDREMRNIPAIIVKYHLNESVFTQYQLWMTEVLKGNLGWSRSALMPVAKAIEKRFPATLEILMFSVPITILGGMFLGVKSAEQRNKPMDHTTKVMSSIGYSLPTFWLGIILIAVTFTLFGFVSSGRLSINASVFVKSRWSGWIPYTGMYTIDGLLNGQPWITVDALSHLVLPVIVLSVANIAIIVLVVRSNMIEILKKRYITVVAMKELAYDEVTSKRLRLATLFPTFTLLGLLFGTTLAGIIVTETVFNMEGIGRWIAHATIQLDIAAVLGLVLYLGFFFVAMSFIVDIVYACIDPQNQVRVS